MQLRIVSTDFVSQPSQYVPATQQPKSRLHGLDYLRGLVAFGIMIYHYSSWTFGELNASSFLGRVGIYGVTIFYILSGMTLSYIYRSNLKLTKFDLTNFYKKRVFRIFPLLWLATFVSIVLSKHTPNIADVFLNVSGLFGLFKWDVYFATGAWSIGNELVFYLIFPLLILPVGKGQTTFILLSFAIIASYFYFTFYGLQPGYSLANQWHIYTNPLNQVLYFLGGVLIDRFTKFNHTYYILNFILLVIGLTIFLLLPIRGNAVELVSGPNRLFFSASCLLICYSFYRVGYAPIFIDKPLSMLGKSSYSLYLLHPIVFAVVRACSALLDKTGNEIPIILIFLISVLISLPISYLSYEYFEMFFMNFNKKRLSTRQNT